MSLILDRIIDVHRLQKDSDNTQKEQYASFAPLQDIAINIQPASPEESVLAEGVFGQAYIAFTTASGILKGDKLVDSTLNENFIVKGKTNWNTPGLIPHTELLLTKFETEE